MKHHLSILLAAAVLCLASMAFVQAGTTQSPAPVTTVHMTDFAFKPDAVTVHVGDTVVFTNDDQATHNVTADAFQSGDIEGGKSWKHTFDKAGTYTYVCTYHASMKGTITVTDT